MRIDMEGWARLKDGQKTEMVQESAVREEEIIQDLDKIEEEERRIERKRGAEREIEESRPKKKRKTKYPRLEVWGESQEQEQEMDTIITIQDYVYREG